MSRFEIEALEGRQLMAFDLQMNVLTTPVVSVIAGTGFTAQVQVSNLGDEASPPARIYYAFTTKDASADTGSDDGPGVVGEIQGVNLDALSPGESATLPLPFSVSRFVPTGQYFFSSTVSTVIDENPDPAGDIGYGTEENDENNSRSASPKVTVLPPVQASVGRPDANFGTGGTATTVVLGPKLEIVATLADPQTGAQYAAATRRTTPPGLALLRLGPDGNPDPAFGNSGDGLFVIPDAPPAVAKSITRSADGSFVLVGTTSDRDVVLVRFNSDGSLDTSASSTGVQVVPSSVFAELAPFDVLRVLPGPSGTTYLVANTDAGANRKIAVLRFAGAALDSTFSDDGVLILRRGSGTTDSARSALVLPDGRVLVAGASKSGTLTSALAVAITPAGVEDATFATGGSFLLPGATVHDRFTTATSGPDGSLYLGGFSGRRDPGATTGGTGSLPLIVRLTSTGKPDRFGKLGIATPDAGATFASVATLIATDDGGVLATVRTASTVAAIGSGQTGVSLVRLVRNGTPLATYGNKGTLIVTPAPVVPAAAADEDFDAFAQSRAADADAVGGGRLRLLAGNTDTPGQTTISVTQLVADGADLAATTAAKFSGTTLTGRTSSLAYTLANRGTLPVSGQVVVTVRLLTSLSDDGTSTGTVARSSSVNLKLLPGASRKQTFKFAFPAVAELRGYFVSVDVATPAGQADVEPSNNLAAAAGVLRVFGPFSETRFELPDGLRLPAAGQSGSFKVNAFNTGNVALSGVGSATLLLVSGPGDLSPLNLGTVPVRANVKPGGKATAITIKGSVPADFTVPPGRFLLITFDGPFLSNERDRTDDEARTRTAVT